MFSICIFLQANVDIKKMKIISFNEIGCKQCMQNIFYNGIG